MLGVMIRRPCTTDFQELHDFLDSSLQIRLSKKESAIKWMIFKKK